MNNNSKSTLQVFDGYKPTLKNEMEESMERKLYLELCQRQAIKGGVLVEYDTISYQPYAYELKFQQDGKIKHTAILKEQKANGLVYCRLEDVNEK